MKSEQSVFKSISVEKDTPFWKKRKIEPNIHWPLRDFRKSWTNSISFGTPFGVSKLHDAFHVSMLRRYRSDPLHILPIRDIQYKKISLLKKSRKLF